MWFLVFASCLALAIAEPVQIHYTGPAVYGYHGPPAPLDKVGRVVDTPEVAHAKEAHFAAYHAEAARNSHPSYAHSEYEHEDGKSVGESVSYGGDSHNYHGYHGPPAPLAHDGRVIDTPEVAHAKAAHFHAYHEELAKVSKVPHHNVESHGYF